MKTVEIVLRSGGGGKKENSGGENPARNISSTCKYHNVSPCITTICY
jgi:hypothetical protein